MMQLPCNMTSSCLVADLKGNIFGHTINTPSAIVKALIVADLWWGGRGLWNPDPKKMKNKPIVDRVNQVCVKNAHLFP